MFKQYSKKILASLVTLNVVLSFNVLAANKDLSQDIMISADRQGADLKSKTSIYFDNVVISQGSLTIYADLVKISANENEAKTYLLKGEPAKLKQTLKDGSEIFLEAKVITYQPESSLITIQGDAKLQQLKNKIVADEIIYRITTEQLNAKGSPAILEQKVNDTNNITLEAKSIIYQPALSLISIKGKAKLKQEGSEVHANQIIYNIATEKMEALGNKDQAVKTILQPQLKSDTNNE